MAEQHSLEDRGKPRKLNHNYQKTWSPLQKSSNYCCLGTQFLFILIIGKRKTLRVVCRIASKLYMQFSLQCVLIIL